MKTVIVIDLVGDDEAVKAERKAEAGQSARGVVYQSPAPDMELVEVSFEDPLHAMPASYRALLEAYFRK
jgi:hypothetical protein